MAIPCECPQCGKHLKAADSAAGKKAKCPDCGAAVPIPAKAPRSQTADDDEFDLQKLNVEEGVEGPVEDDRIPCPMCGEMIIATARKCRFCGEEVNQAPKRTAKKKSRGSTASEDSDLSAVEWVLCILCSGIGCIVGIVYMIQGKPKGAKMLGVSLLVWLTVAAVRAVLTLAMNK
jgi:DNA-directed RNA polymerase subunit M/transcription elongation factor TFIIS